MRVAIYARVSTDAQEARGTIGSQLALLRERMVREGHELVAEYTDDGLSGARLDRPGLDALRDAAEAGYFEGVWCLSADRLARMYAYQVIVLDELSRHGVTVRFHDTPQIEDDPQARLLTQVQGVIAEYERAKIGERYRRGKLWRSRAGEVIAWKVPYGYRRLPRAGERPAHLEVFEREAAVVRRIFDDYVRKDISMRQIAMGLNRDGICSPTGRAVWGVSTIGRHLAQRSLYRPGLLQSNRDGAATPTRGQNPAGATPARSMDRHRGAGNPRRDVVRSGAACQSRQLAVEPQACRARTLAATRAGQVRSLSRGRVVPQDARAQRHVPSVLLLPQPRSPQGRWRTSPLPGAQYSCR